MDEQIILQADKVFRWEGPKRKQTLVNAKLGRLVLTDRRLLFLSTGKNDINLRRVGGAALSPAAGLTTGKTSDLDLDAVHADGGMAISVEQLRSAELTTAFKVLTISWAEGDGTSFSTFAPKNGGMPDGRQWVDALQRSIGSGLSQPVGRPASASSVGPSMGNAEPAMSPAPPAGAWATPEPAAAPSRPGRAVTGYLNPDRLATTVEALTQRFGVAILDQPSRVRNLLRDEYGADATRDRSDIETFVSVLEQRPLSALDEGRSEREVVGDLTRATTLTEPGAAWTLSVLQRARPADDVGSDGTVLDTLPGTVSRADVPIEPTSIERGTSTSRPGRSRTVVLVAIVALVGLAAAMIAWFSGRSSVDEWKERALDAEAALESAETTGAADDDAADAEESAVATAPEGDDPDELRAAYEQAAAQVAALAAERDRLSQDVATGQGTIAQLQVDLDTVNQQLAAAQAQVPQPFVTGAPRHPLGDISGTGDLTQCDGFSDACSATWHLDARIVDDGSGRYFEVPNMALVPITSPDGSSWTGYANIIGEFGAFTCDGSRITTTFTVTLHPADYRVDPAAQTIDVVSYDVDFSFFSRGTGCTDATSAYRGRFQFA